MERVTAQTVPSGVVFDILIPLATWEEEATKRPGMQTSEDWVGPIATQIEYYFGSGQVTGARYEEDLDANGLVGFFIVFDVAIQPPVGQPPLENTAEVRVPLLALGERLLINSVVQPAIDAARDALVANAAL